MRWRHLTCCLCGLVAALPLNAGAWLREEGRSFVSLAYEVTTPVENLSQEALAYDPTPELYGYTSIYAEHGLTDWLTVGLDAGREEGPETWDGVVFLRLPLAPADWPHRFAVQIGGGQRRYVQPGPFYPQESDEHEAIGRIGLGWGYGFARPLHGGWLAVDGSYEYRFRTGGNVRKLDATAGLRTGEKTSLLMQVQSGDYPDSPAYAKLLTGVVQDLGHGLSLEASLISGIRNDDKIGMRTALWWSF